MNTHYYEVCEYGVVHGQCRCFSNMKTTRKIKCPTATVCAGKTGTKPGEPYEPKHRK